MPPASSRTIHDEAHGHAPVLSTRNGNGRHRPEPPKGADRRSPWDGIIGYFWSSIWLFWLIDPLRVAWGKGSWGGVAAILGFGAVYLRHFHRQRLLFSDHSPARTRGALDSPWLATTRYLVMAVLAAVAIVLIGQPGASCLVFFGIAAMWTFDVQPALAVAAVTASTYVILWHTVDGWTTDYGSLIGLSFGTVACLTGRLSAERKRALDASRAENSALIVQEERNRMARDLHDILGHSLTVITVKAELAGRLLEHDSDAARHQARTELGDLERISREALADIRRAVEGYRELTLGGEIARARQALTAAGIEPDLPRSVDEVSPDLNDLFAWALRESVTNVIRHSHATHCTVTLAPTSIMIEDDGGGVSAARDHQNRTGYVAGRGLEGLRERAAAAGAAVTITDVEPHGTRLVVAAQPVLPEREPYVHPPAAR